MTLNHSKTWPVSTLAVVQLRVDPHGRTYSTLTDRDFPEIVPFAAPDHPPPPGNCTASEDYCNNVLHGFALAKCDHDGLLTRDAPDDGAGNVVAFSNRVADDEELENGVVFPLSKRHLELFTKMSAGRAIRTAIRTDTVSTILEQETELDYESTNGEIGECYYYCTRCLLGLAQTASHREV